MIKLTKLKKFYKSDYSTYKYKDWYIEDTGLCWMARKGHNGLGIMFKTLKDAKNYIYKKESK